MTEDYVLKETVVIGAGISGLAVARWLKKYDFDFVVIERSDDIGGLWRYREDDYGVMEFTHINVSKHNYCYSDHPFPKDAVDYPHHSEMYKYIKSYADKNELFSLIKFKNEVVLIEELKADHPLQTNRPEFKNAKFYDRLWSVVVKNLETNVETTYIAPYVSIATGHHGLPSYAHFPGQETFPDGKMIHSVKYKSATFNKMNGKRVLVVGIGNSAVDIVVNLVNEGKCENVTLSTRSGAWIIPNYISGYPTDLYACRTFLNIPWKIGAFIMESTIKFIYGNPKQYNLNPKMKPLQSQPTVSPTLIHHIQRNEIKVKPNIKLINGSEVTFDNDEKQTFDYIILCTGYKIDLHYLEHSLRKKIFANKGETNLQLYKHTFHPEIGRSLAFIGYVQPSSGGLLTVSEIQARWFVQLMLNRTRLPFEEDMKKDITNEHTRVAKRYHTSKRHALQVDPLLYNDSVSEFFDAKPSYIDNLRLLPRLLFGSCGPAQWRINGPDSTEEAIEQLKSVPITDMMKLFALLTLLVVLVFLMQVLQHPHLFGLLGVSYVFYNSLYKNRV